ncbi:MAG: ATP synthase subunit I [Acidobacteriota bacterium]
MKRIYRNAMLILVLMVPAATAAFGASMGLSVLIGGLLAVVNFHWMSAGVDALLKRAATASVRATVAKYLARLVLIFLTLFAIIHSSFLSVLGAVAGLSVFVIAGMLEAVLLLIRPETGTQTDK